MARGPLGCPGVKWCPLRTDLSLPASCRELHVASVLAGVTCSLRVCTRSSEAQAGRGACPDTGSGVVGRLLIWGSVTAPQSGEKHIEVKTLPIHIRNLSSSHPPLYRMVVLASGLFYRMASRGFSRGCWAWRILLKKHMPKGKAFALGVVGVSYIFSLVF